MLKESQLITQLYYCSQVQFTDLQCAFWNFSTASWETTGCCLDYSKEFPQCKCNHLTNFALIVVSIYFFTTRLNMWSLPANIKISFVIWQKESCRCAGRHRAGHCEWHWMFIVNRWSHFYHYFAFGQAVSWLEYIIYIQWTRFTVIALGRLFLMTIPDW